MSPIAISWIVFVCVFSGALIGMVLRSRLPESHLSADSKDVIKLAMGLLGTMSALVLALLISSAKSSHDAQRGEVTRMAADFILLDRVLAQYGPESKDARELLRVTLAEGVNKTWSHRVYHSASLDSPAMRAAADNFFEKIQQLKPRDEFHRLLYARAVSISGELGRLRSMLLEQTESSIPMPFLVVLIFWLTVIFVGMGLLARLNPTVLAVLFLCSLSIAGAIFLVLELDRPFEGFIQVSSAPLRNALVHLDK